MSFQWLDFLQLARRLEKTSIPDVSHEAIQRTIIGRCYYAAFCSARDSLHKSGALSPAFDERDHALVILALRRAKLVGWAERLQELRNLRNQADYELNARSLEGRVAAAISDAESILKVLK